MSDKQTHPDPRVATAADVRGLLLVIDAMEERAQHQLRYVLPGHPGDTVACLRVIRAQRAVIAEIVAARKAVWESTEGTVEGYAAHDRLREAIAAAEAMMPKGGDANAAT